MAERYYAAMTDEAGVSWRVSLYDSAFASAASEIQLEHPKFKISWPGENPERFDPVKPSSCEVYWLVNSSAQEAVLSLIAGAQEERFSIRIQRGDDLYWVGWVMTDLISIDDAAYPFSTTITATDGLGRLSDIEYWNAGTPYTGDDDFLTIIDNILDHVGLDSFWGATDPYIHTEVNWIEDTYHPAVAAGNDPLYYSRTNEGTFLEMEVDDFGHYVVQLDPDGDPKVLSCGDVLREVCKAWGMRCYLAGGVYRFEQVDQLRESSIYYRDWDKSLTLQDSGTWNRQVSIDQSSIAKLSTGTDTFYPPLLRVIAEHEHRSGYNLLGTNTTLADDTNLGNTSIGAVSNGAGNFIHIKGRVRYEYEMTSPYNEHHYAGVAIYAKLDTAGTDYYLDGSSRTITGATTYNMSSQVPQWTTTSTDKYYYWFPNGMNNINDIVYLDFVVNTPAIPVDADLTVSITFLTDPYTNSFGGTPSTELTWYFSGLSVIYVEGQDSNFTEVNVRNTTDGSTSVDSKNILDLGRLLIGDAVTNQSRGGVEVSDDHTTWYDSSSWTVGGSGTAYGMTELLCREVMAGQRVPARRMQAAIFGGIDPYDVLSYDSKLWAFASFELTGATTEASGEWFEVARSITNIATDFDDEIINDDGGGLGTTSALGGAVSVLGGTLAAQVNYNQRRSVATTSSRLAAGDTVDEVDIDAIGSQILSQGDVLTLFNPYDGSYETVTIDETPQSDATTVAIESTTLDYDYPPGSMLFYTTPAEMNLAFDPTKTGWDDDYESNVTLAFVDGTRTFSITPTGSEFYYYINGVKFVKDSAQSVVIDDTEGTWFIYFVQGTLTASQTPWSIAANDKAFVSVLYWDATNKEAVLAPAYEMHGWLMDSAVHHYLHSTFGARWQSGLAVSINGTTTIDVSAGSIHDEDIQANITDGAGSSTWEQVLSPAECPILYRDGASGYWRRIDASTTPCYLDTNVLQYNAYEGGVWSLEDCALNKFVAYWVLATTCVEEPIILVPGQEQGDTLDDARDGNSSADMLFGNLPVSEFKIIARLLIQRESGSPYYSVDEVNDYRSSSGDSSSSAPLVGDHGSLTGLLDDDHSQYMAMARAGDISGLSAKTTPVAADVLVIEDSAASNAKKKVTVESLWRVPTGTKTTGVDNGTTGDIYVDDDWLYICTDTNVWKKTALHNTA